ncbi:nuclear transport factor 2 family protein [Candidatus Sumerlaeota bacterium]|nr:nuclear transport factor 2 family protein [Candidatus Sumerlaeota bacterium]
MEKNIQHQTRRGFLAAGGIGAAALALGVTARGVTARGGAEEAKAPTEQEAANMKVVNDFCAAWAAKDADKLGEFLADNAVFRSNDKAPMTNGREAIVKSFGIFLKMASTAEFVVHRTTAIGNIVLNERTDKFTMGGQDKAYHMSGVFCVKEGKIVEWFDYGMPK